MAKPRIIYNNLWRDGTIGATLTSENPQHPGSDTQIDTLSMFWRSINDTVDPTLLPCDLGAAYEINFIALLDHNIAATSTIYFEGADDEDFSGGDLVTRELTHNADNIFEFITAFTKRWVRLRITTPGNDDDYIQIGTVICGKYFELSKTVGLGYEEGYEDFSELEYSDSQVIFAQEKEIIEVRSLPFRGLDDATRANILLFFNECGIHKAFVICFNSTAANTNSYWVVNTEMTPPRYEQNDCWHWRLAIREIV